MFFAQRLFLGNLQPVEEMLVSADSRIGRFSNRRGCERTFTLHPVFQKLDDEAGFVGIIEAPLPHLFETLDAD